MATTIYDHTVTTADGRTIDFADFRGQPMLIVNTASKCGFAYQYEGLQQLHEQFGPQGLVVIGMPSNQFRQELGEESEIESFCTLNFGVTFPLTAKVDVNGSDTDPVFAFLKDRSRGTFGSAIKWNFTKFLVGPDGTTVTRYGPKTEPKAIAEDVAALMQDRAA
jgi:glutathione peroxidase